MENCFVFADELGPSKIVHVYEPSIELRGILVVDNVARGPSIGGVRMAEDVSVEECFRLARAMTFKNAAAGLPHGGGKAVLFGDPRMEKARKQTLIRGLAKALRTEEDYIFAPDMGTDEECMAWVKDEIGRVVALPREVGGIPLDEIGATGWGLLNATEVALESCGFALQGARLVVQGFGAVGRHAARFLTERGALLVGAADSRGAIHNPAGLDVQALQRIKDEGGSVADSPEGERLERDAVVGLPCDIWIPAARPDVVDESNVDQLQARLVVEGANIPFTPGAEQRLHERGVLVVPDFIANAGGVICAAMELHGSTETAALEAIEERVRRNTRIVLEDARRRAILPRQAAIEMAEARVRKAMGFRRYSLFSSAPGYV
ncbi:MAG: Glu/Leu/Phe/Val dehydrogenase [Thiocapsa sp.]|jgi:glutamate dehydrogenase (NAD(P)+)|nr:Glu/Leu/Phe/Val dehydrogenase [Thiocapsa sp.]MCG6897853.1 Glu/Leu/Phe/Val dehydrogenase [Thiocapsa sp.]